MAQTAAKAASSPARPATIPQSVPLETASRPASTAQLTGLKRAASWIQPGARFPA
jgi:hypothetical protein